MSKFSRREFVAGVTTAATAFLAPSLAFGEESEGASRAFPENRKIERIEAFPVRYPTVLPFRFLEGPGGTGRPAVLVKITADDGTVGWGESVPVPRWSYETLEASVIAIERYLAPVLTGHNPFDLTQREIPVRERGGESPYPAVVRRWTSEA